MTTEQVTPTRSELNLKRAQIELVEKGRDLLQQKRNALMEELRRSADEVLSEEQALDDAAATARRALALALVRTASDRPHSPTHSAPRLDAVALAFEAKLEALMDVANQELRLRRLAEAIRETIRRVNARCFTFPCAIWRSSMRRTPITRRSKPAPSGSPTGPERQPDRFLLRRPA